MITRRQLMQHAAASAALIGSGLSISHSAQAAEPDLPQALPEGTRSEAVLDTLPGKKPLIKLSYRPPNYESPLSYLRTPITPNDEFFVRYHLTDIPQVDAKTWKLTVGGEGANGRATVTFDDLKALPAREIVAVCQCSGNRRGLFDPHVAGVEW
ncbi:MAG: molybdopterin-dependent oxidoreductase, partial [Acetobacteraceae bacterium]|nr:molybdopterin-dependent oxidoreductase [Acetobacteraceae bacterium]